MPEKPIHPIDVILHKRDGRILSTTEIDYFVRGVVSHTATDAQIAAFLMAVFHHGLNRDELAALTTAMRFSGEVFDASPLATFTVDKHSTGGVGDKTSLLIAPTLAAAGLAAPTAARVPGICVPMISGRSLGHTGGTLDKLETIPGFNSQLSLAEFLETLRTCAAALIGQTPAIVPADRILYALRDHTGTVESPFLICASIMSKKLAESLNALVLDVKTGSGAFMPSYEKSKLLATLMVQTGEASGTRTVALLTTHDEPLGRFAGNWLEVQECVDIMQQRRHPMSADLIGLSNILSGWMLHLAGHAATPEAGAAQADAILRSGAAYGAWLKIVAAQGGDISVFDNPPNGLASFAKPGSPPSALTGWGGEGGGSASSFAVASRVFTATESGFLHSMDCREVGWAVQRLGAGRAKPGDPVSALAGIEIHAKLGTRVESGQPLVTFFAESEAQLTEPYEMLRATYRVAPERPTLNPLIREVIKVSDQQAK
jgi:pyrimidine-nucleoside phosphorylase